jgi:hypothetical protein
MRPDLHTLTAQVQHNCHISDARHARNYSLCIYLLKMREYFRWERGFGYSERLPEKELGDWLMEREHLWGEIEEQDYHPIELDSGHYPPFESENIGPGLQRRLRRPVQTAFLSRRVAPGGGAPRPAYPGHRQGVRT